MGIFDYFEENNLDKLHLCQDTESIFSLVKVGEKIGLEITYLPNNKRTIYGKEFIIQEIEKLTQSNCNEIRCVKRNIYFDLVLKSA